MAEYSQVIVDNIKHEPERNFVFIKQEDPEPEFEEVKVKIVSRKFDKKWMKRPEFFEYYLVCGNCEYATRQSRYLDHHLKTCKGFQKCGKCNFISKSEKVEECRFCDLKFDCSNCKTNHINEDHRNGTDWYCTKCEFKTLRKNNLQVHFQIHVKNIYDCGSCTRSFASKGKLKEHEKYVHSEKKFHCDICGKIFKNKILLQQHMQSHIKSPCPVCKRMFTKHRLTQHIEQHSSTTKFNCGVCDKVFSSKKGLYEHNLRDHSKNEVQCDLCGEKFRNKYLLKAHMRNHLKVSCPICKRLMKKYALNVHIKKLHPSGDKSLFCLIKRCELKFKNIKELRKHEKIHIGPKCYKCPTCNHQTKKIRGMKRHMETQSH